MDRLPALHGPDVRRAGTVVAQLGVMSDITNRKRAGAGATGELHHDSRP